MVFHAWIIALWAVEGGAILWYWSPKPWPALSLPATAVGSQSPHALKWGLAQLQPRRCEGKQTQRGMGVRGEKYKKEKHMSHASTGVQGFFCRYLMKNSKRSHEITQPCHSFPSGHPETRLTARVSGVDDVCRDWAWEWTQSTKCLLARTRVETLDVWSWWMKIFCSFKLSVLLQ